MTQAKLASIVFVSLAIISFHGAGIYEKKPIMG